MTVVRTGAGNSRNRSSKEPRIPTGASTRSAISSTRAASPSMSIAPSTCSASSRAPSTINRRRWSRSRTIMCLARSCSYALAEPTTICGSSSVRNTRVVEPEDRFDTVTCTGVSPRRTRSQRIGREKARIGSPQRMFLSACSPCTTFATVVATISVAARPGTSCSMDTCSTFPFMTVRTWSSSASWARRKPCNALVGVPSASYAAFKRGPRTARVISGSIGATSVTVATTRRGVALTTNLPCSSAVRANCSTSDARTASVVFRTSA
ncbi:hypothetical protein GALL_450670 [mine drainage metagenome]|uniref:Uncharacterized protein n=1 Tax=mine drainage metagenome TaxID=410659 RepID=A0A1J5PQ92_9ZZZZ